MKACTKCKVVKDSSEFGKRYGVPDGLQSWCKQCTKMHRELKKDSQREWQRKYYQKNRQRFLRLAKEYREANKEKIARDHKKYVERNKDRLDEYHKNYREKNRKLIVKKQGAYQKRRYAEDPKFCLVVRMRALVRNALKKKGATKSKRTVETLGCTPEFFREHIERQFLKGMSWDNRDQWQLDHIIPISTAETEEDVYALSHFTNIRPMWADDNKEKSGKITTLL